MSSREQYLVERIDRAKEAPAAKAERSRREMYLRMQARRTVRDMLADLDPQEQAIILRDTLDMVGEQLHPIIGRVEAATSFNAVAADICAIFRLPRAIKNAAAEHAFAKLTKAANDRGEG